MKHVEMTLNIIYGYKCNYRCKGCSNGSDQVTHTNYDPSLDEILESIPKLAQYFDIAHDGMITLLGGEIYLYWDKVVAIARQTRKYFPKAKINLFTNGQLLSLYINETINLMKELDNSCVHISRHLQGIYETKIGKKWLDNIEQVKNHTEITIINDDFFQIKNHSECNFHAYDGVAWFTWYKQMPGGTIKPHASGDPVRSARYGCASGLSCSALFGSKFYKCGSLAMLPGLLKQKQQIDDPDWKKYVEDYPYIDLNNFDIEKYQYYVDTYNIPIPQCDMCNNNPNNIMEWKDRTYIDIFPKKSSNVNN
jgi:organic radical activating enzyme